MHGGVIGRIPFFKNKDKNFIAIVVPTLQPLKLSSNSFIYKTGDHPYESKNKKRVTSPSIFHCLRENSIYSARI
jgi:hypothetical protein